MSLSVPFSSSPLSRPRRYLWVGYCSSLSSRVHPPRIHQARTVRRAPEHFPGMHSNSSAARIPNVSLIRPISRRHRNPRSGAFSARLDTSKLQARRRARSRAQQGAASALLDVDAASSRNLWFRRRPRPIHLVAPTVQRTIRLGRVLATTSSFLSSSCPAASAPVHRLLRSRKRSGCGIFSSSTHRSVGRIGIPPTHRRVHTAACRMRASCSALELIEVRFRVWSFRLAPTRSSQPGLFNPRSMTQISSSSCPAASARVHRHLRHSRKRSCGGIFSSSTHRSVVRIGIHRRVYTTASRTRASCSALILQFIGALLRVSSFRVAPTDSSRPVLSQFSFYESDLELGVRSVPSRPSEVNCTSASRRESNRAIQHSRALINLSAYAQRQYGLGLHHARRDREVALANLPSSTATQASAWVASGGFRRTSSILPSFSPALPRVLSRSTRSRRGLAFRPPALVNIISRHFAPELHPAYSCNIQTRTSAVSMRFESSSWRSCLRASPPHRLLQHRTRQPALELLQIYGAHTCFNGLPESDAASRRSTRPRPMFPHFEFPRSSALRRLTLNVNDTLGALELRRNMRTLSYNSTRVLLVELGASRSAVAPSIARARTSTPGIPRIFRRSAYLHEVLHLAPRRANPSCVLQTPVRVRDDPRRARAPSLRNAPATPQRLSNDIQMHAPQVWTRVRLPPSRS